MADFTKAEWKTIFTRLTGKEVEYGFPERRKDSVVLASFNIRDFGNPGKRSPGAWKLLTRICKRFDFIAVQEVEDDLASLRQLREALGPKYSLVHSDISGALPSELGPISPHERLAFLYRIDKVERGELASDITFDRSYIFETLYGHRRSFATAFDDFQADLKDFKNGRRSTAPYFIALSKFVAFIRPPHAVSFRIPGKTGAAPYEFVAVNAHLLYGGGRKRERKMEFEALVSWLFDRAKKAETMPVKDMILFGDLNLDFSRPEKQRPLYDARLKELNGKLDPDDEPADFNFPFLDSHPKLGVIRSNARLSETYDQIGIIRRDPRLPGHELNALAGKKKGHGFDFGVVDFVRLFQDALMGGRSVTTMTTAEKRAFIGRFEYDVSDHMPIWIRLPLP